MDRQEFNSTVKAADQAERDRLAAYMKRRRELDRQIGGILAKANHAWQAELYSLAEQILTTELNPLLEEWHA